ncbi:MAG TPA: acetyl-CoA carboxylase biotin carboxylase subunit [Chloroflexota bacterium]|nr:acetyl-CoA carboxylase biotin carboxylase subunit [Chloroflexota bacterium]
MPLARVLVANRGEIAVRVIRACHALGAEAVVAVSEADRDSLPARLADRAVCIGPPPPGQSYLRVEALVAAALGTGCDALHPGYGFLAESPALAVACAEHGVAFVGPRAESIRQMGHKLAARALAAEHGVPTAPGSTRVRSASEAAAVAQEIGFPVIVKAAAGGGGRGIKVVEDAAALGGVLEIAAAEARAAFGDDALYLERYVARARHVEVQVLGDRHGQVIHLGERDCSLQRRYQKIVEEGPATFVAPAARDAMRAAAVRLAAAIGYESAGTVEFLYDQDTRAYYFLEMNTRIQVEHPVTEMISGTDLVQAQLRIAAGEPLPYAQADLRLAGHAVECRITAESAAHGFRPSPGTITRWDPPGGPGVRVDTHCYAGYTVPPYYDSLLAKLIVHGADRAEALARLRAALAGFLIEGIDTTIPFLRALVSDPAFVAGQVSTRWVEERLAALAGGAAQ